MKGDEPGCEYKKGSIQFCTPCGVWYDMAPISLQQSNLRVEMATSFQRPAVSSVPHRHRCPAKQHAAFSGTMMPSLNNRNNDSTAGREMEQGAGLRGGGVYIQQFGRKRM